jgi:glucokinase
MSEYVVGIDIGGTKVAIGVVDESGKVLADCILPTDLRLHPTEMVDKISEAINDLVKKQKNTEEKIRGIGIGAPGPLDAIRGVITCPPNLPGWTDFSIVEEFKKKFNLPIVLENDANAATLAEKWVGAAQSNHSFVYITISTGIGSGLYMNGKLISGAKGNAGDIGHIVIDPSKGTCTCGQKGCFEWVASGPAIARQASEMMGQPLTTKQAFQLFEERHPKIVPLVEEVFQHIGMGCVTIINMLDPQVIVIGGGVSEVGDRLFNSVQQYINRYALNPAGRQTRVIRSALRQHAGLIGAASLLFSDNN